MGNTSNVLLLLAVIPLPPNPRMCFFVSRVHFVAPRREESIDADAKPRTKGKSSH